jgi:hypothetical protein
MKHGTMQRHGLSVLRSVFLLIIIYFVYSIARPGPCDGIFEQKAPKLDTTLSFLKANREVGIGSVGRPRTLERSSPLSYLARVFLPETKARHHGLFGRPQSS